MYRINFYGESSLPTSNKSNPLLNHPIMPRISFGSSTENIAAPSFSDGFQDKKSSFEKALHDEYVNLDKRRDKLESDMQLLEQGKLNEEQKQVIVEEYAAISRAEKMMEVFVAEVQKCVSSIMANFR